MWMHSLTQHKFLFGPFVVEGDYIDEVKTDTDRWEGI